MFWSLHSHDFTKLLYIFILIMH